MELHNYIATTSNVDAFINTIIVFSYSFAKVHFGHSLMKHVQVIQRRWLVDTIKLHAGQNLTNTNSLVESLYKLIKNPKEHLTSPAVA